MEAQSLKSLQSKSQDISRKSRPAVVSKSVTSHNAGETSRAGQTAPDRQLEHLKVLTAHLQQNLALCAEPDARTTPKAQTSKTRISYTGSSNAKEDHALHRKPAKGEPSVNAVHDVRTGTRRVEAILDALTTSLLTAHAASPAAHSQSASQARSGNGAKPKADSSQTALADAIERWQRLLRKIRRSAGAVRDLDVHRKILAGLLKDLDRQASPRNHAAGSSQELDPHHLHSDNLEHASPAPAPAPPLSALHVQADNLDAWLRHSRHDASQPLMRGAHKWADRLESRLSALAEALAGPGRARRKSLNAATSALEAFARLSHEMEQLAAYNLHDFRKGAKKARYMAETGGDDEYAGAIGKALKKLQDEIGDWHDWLVLAEEAHRALGETGLELTARIEQERDRLYLNAMKTAERLRGRLMGEWYAASERSHRPRTPRTKTF